MRKVTFWTKSKLSGSYQEQTVSLSEIDMTEDEWDNMGEEIKLDVVQSQARELFNVQFGVYEK